MTTHKHTPGPWVAPGAVVHAYDDRKNLVTIALCQAECWRGIDGVETYPLVPGMDGAEDEGQAECYANAALIAAAPDLLAALEAIVGQTDKHRDTSWGGEKRSAENFMRDPNTGRAFIAARAAIARATGQN